MTSPVDALVLVDLQTAFVSGPDAVPSAAALLDRASDLLDRARAAGAIIPRQKRTVAEEATKPMKRVVLLDDVVAE